MGAVFGIIFGLPVAIFWMIISPFIGFFTGADKVEIILPYDEESGVIWEYDNYQDVYIKLADTRFEGDKQFFTFRRNYLVFDEGNGGMATDLVFTDKNGNSQTYYIACANGGFGMKAMAPGEYATYSHTAKVETPVKDGYWLRESSDGINADLLLYSPVEKSDEAEFTLVYPLDDEYIGQQRAMGFVYISGKREKDKHEKERLLYKVSEDGTFTIIRIIET